MTADGCDNTEKGNVAASDKQGHLSYYVINCFLITVQFQKSVADEEAQRYELERFLLHACPVFSFEDLQ